MALRRASKHYFSSFSFFFFGKREKGRNVSENILFMDVDIVFCDVPIIRRYVCICFRKGYIVLSYVEIDAKTSF